MSCDQFSYKDVGDIPFDSELDDRDFLICNEGYISQYYSRGSSDTPTSYKAEKRGLEREILSQYSLEEIEGESGYITIRFIVNCEGDTGRFRVEEMNFDYKEKKFDAEVTTQLLKIVKELKGWIPRKRKNRSMDTYQYLTFRMEDGQIKKVLP